MFPEFSGFFTGEIAKAAEKLAIADFLPRAEIRSQIGSAAYCSRFAVRSVRVAAQGDGYIGALNDRISGAHASRVVLSALAEGPNVRGE